MAYKPMETPEFTFLDDHKIIRKSTKEGGWNLEFNHIVWNNGEPKYDIRAWSPDHTHMAKGIGLTESECKTLRNILVDKFGPRDDASIEVIPSNPSEESEGGIGEDIF